MEKLSCLSFRIGTELVRASTSIIQMLAWAVSLPGLEPQWNSQATAKWLESELVSEDGPLSELGRAVNKDLWM